MKVMRSVVIDAPIATVWAAVRDFDGVVNWNPGVTAATLESGTSTEVGAIRRLDIVDGSVFRETLLAHSDLEHFYTYDILESPLACRNYVACHRFVEITDGNKTLGIWQGEFDCADTLTDELDAVVGDGIYLAAQQALNSWIQEN